MAKYTHLEDFFLNHVLKVARYHVATVFVEGVEQLPATKERSDTGTGINNAVGISTVTDSGLQ